MSDQASGWDNAPKIVGTIVASIGSLWAYWKARNINHADRISKLERLRRDDLQVMADVKQQMLEMTSNVDIRLGSNERRIRKLEVDANDLDRMVRDSLQRMIDQIDRRLHGDGMPRTQQEQPRP